MTIEKDVSNFSLHYSDISSIIGIEIVCRGSRVEVSYIPVSVQEEQPFSSFVGWSRGGNAQTSTNSRSRASLLFFTFPKFQTSIERSGKVAMPSSFVCLPSVVLLQIRPSRYLRTFPPISSLKTLVLFSGTSTAKSTAQPDCRTHVKSSPVCKVNLFSLQQQ